MCVTENYFSFFSTKAYVVGSFEHPKQFFKLKVKKIFTILGTKILLIFRPVIIILCLIQYFEADFLWKVSLKILN